MHILIVTVLCAVVFGDLSSDNKRLKRTNSALLQALKQMTQSETAIGDKKMCTSHRQCPGIEICSGGYCKTPTALENAVGESEDYSVFDSNGGCGEGLALTEDECKNARIGTWKKASTWSLPETCGCFLEGDNRYFNRLNGACNRPDSGERMICKKITCTNQKEGQCSDWYRKKEWIQIFDVTRDKCHEKCAELAATRGEGCCQFGPESPEHLSQDDSCYFVIGDKVRRLSSSGPSFYEKRLRVSECSA